MLFTATDIQRILSNVDYTIARVIAEVLGKDYLKKEDIELLKKRGVDLLKLIPKFPAHYQAYLFGRISAAIGIKPSRQMKYSDFAKFLSKMGLFAPKNVEIEFYKGRVEYEYEINALTGDIIEFDTEM